MPHVSYRRSGGLALTGLGQRSVGGWTGRDHGRYLRPRRMAHSPLAEGGGGRIVTTADKSKMEGADRNVSFGCSLMISTSPCGLSTAR